MTDLLTRAAQPVTICYMNNTPKRPTSDKDHAILDAAWHQAFDALRAAGLESDADDPIAAEYRAASLAVNHANRSRDFYIMSGRAAELAS